MTKAFAIVLAAGASTRMGKCKTQLAWGDNQNLLTYQIQQWLWANVKPIIVLGQHNAEFRFDDLSKIKKVINLQANLGKTRSILAGLAAIPKNYQSVAISAVDQPRETIIYQQLIHQYHQQQAMITVPTYQGKKGHPIILDRQMHSALMKISEQKMGLRQIINDFDKQIHQVEFATADILVDINTPEQYQSHCERISFCLTKGIFITSQSEKAQLSKEKSVNQKLFPK